jgi:hypothetical protein
VCVLEILTASSTRPKTDSALNDGLMIFAHPLGKIKISVLDNVLVSHVHKEQEVK